MNHSGIKLNAEVGGWHLCVQENDPLLGNKEVDATGLVAPTFLHFSTLGPENICPVERGRRGVLEVWFLAFDASGARRCERNV